MNFSELPIEPVRKSVTVKRSIQDAFEIFTSGINRWWPLKTHSVSEERAISCHLETQPDGMIYEVRDDGQRFTWGRILVWEPPRRLVFSWHPGREEETAQEVEVRFIEVAGATVVELEHRGWEKLGDRARTLREDYEKGWELVFNKRFAEICRN